jgi:hypothetical protein
MKQNVLLHQDIKISQGYYRPSQKVSRAAVYSSESQMAIIKTTKIGSFPLPGIEKLSPSKPHSHTERNPATGAEIKIPGKSTDEMWVAEAAGEAEEAGKPLSPNGIRNFNYILKKARRWPNPPYPAPSFSESTIQIPRKRA